MKFDRTDAEKAGRKLSMLNRGIDSKSVRISIKISSWNIKGLNLLI